MDSWILYNPDVNGWYLCACSSDIEHLHILYWNGSSWLPDKDEYINLPIVDVVGWQHLPQFPYHLV